MREIDIVVIGTLAYDDIETPFGKRDRILGGSATHFSMAASLLSKVGIVSIIGEDFNGDDLNLLEKRGINLDGVERRKGKTFHWSGYYSYDMNVAHTKQTDLNVLVEFDPKLPESFRSPNILFLANIDPELQLKVLDSVDDVWLKAMDTMNFWIDNKKDRVYEVIKRVDILFINDSELRQLQGEANLIKAARSLMDINEDLTVVVKKGEHGALLIEKNHLFALPSYPTENVIDPTGAGDSFAGGFLSFISSKNNFDEQTKRQALVVGTATASFYIEGFGIEGFIGRSFDDIIDRANMLRNFVYFEPL